MNYEREIKEKATNKVIHEDGDGDGSELTTNALTVQFF